jgi:putative alpha-1,2-mannosidase
MSVFCGVEIKQQLLLGPVPNGSINPSPQTAPGQCELGYGWLCYGNSIRGFGQLHVVAFGWGNGQVFISPLKWVLAVGRKYFVHKRE